MKCYIKDLMSLDQKKTEYTEPIYTKLNGMYGYISVSMFKVFFFWFDHFTETVCYDDVSEKFEVEYILN